MAIVLIILVDVGLDFMETTAAQVSYSTDLWIVDVLRLLGFVDDASIIPILSVGDYNLTRKNFTSSIVKHKMLLVGFSSYSCLKVLLAVFLPLVWILFKCIRAEAEYVKIHNTLKTMQVVLTS